MVPGVQGLEKQHLLSAKSFLLVLRLQWLLNPQCAHLWVTIFFQVIRLRPTTPSKLERNRVFYPPWRALIWAYHFIRAPASECQSGRKGIKTHTLFRKPAKVNPGWEGGQAKSAVSWQH